MPVLARHRERRRGRERLPASADQDKVENVIHIFGCAEAELTAHRLVDILSILTSLFTVDAIFMMGSGEEALLAGVPVDLGNVAQAGNTSGELPRVVVVSQTSREMSRIMTAQVRSSLLRVG